MYTFKKLSHPFTPPFDVGDTHKADQETPLNQVTYCHALVCADGAINNGAYKAGFSRSQKVYTAAYNRYFAALDKLNQALEKSKFLCGNAVTEADVYV